MTPKDRDALVPDTFRPLPEILAEAERLRIMLDAGEGDTDALYPAYNALLLVLSYGVKPPSEVYRADPKDREALRTDIVEQLREKARWRPHDVHGDLHNAAADEIERLRLAPPAAEGADKRYWNFREMREALEWIEKDDRYWTNNQTADEVLECAPSGNVKIRGPYARRAYAALAAPQSQEGERAAMDAIRNYLATFDRCGGSESVSADEFAECRAAMRAVVTRPDRGAL
jgi:hypothetical protein